MAQRWCYMRNGQECGPVSTADLRLLADQERLQPTDMVRANGSPKWIEAGTVKGLFYSGPASARGSGGRVAGCLILLAVVVVLTAGGVAVLFYSLYGFGVPAASSPPTTEPPGGNTPGENPGLSDAHGKGLSPRRERGFWRSSRGYFENTSGDQWREKFDEAQFHYVEQDRTPKYVELYDASRNVTVRLHPNQCEMKVNGKFERKLEGAWEARPESNP